MSVPREDFSGDNPNSRSTVLLHSRIEEICRRFTSDLKNGSQPRIEDFLSDIASEGRSELLLRLLREELDFRRQTGDSVEINSLLSRFPEHQETVAMAFQPTEPRPGLYDTAAPAELARRLAPPTSGLSNRNADRYQRIRQLGKGAFGVVWLAEDLELRRRVALKEPRLPRPSDVDAFLTEARTVAGLDHPGIVPVYDVGRTSNGNCYVVSKFIEGSDLQTLISCRKFSPHEAVSIVSRVADALHYAHQKNLVHRDVKPANILIDKQGAPWLADFGIALQDDQVGYGPVFVGTPAYMSPEQVTGKSHRVDGRTDIYSLAVVLYELLVGRRPYRAKDERELYEQICTMEVKPLRQISDHISEELERVCLKAISREIKDRYSTARDFANALRAITDLSVPASALVPDPAFIPEPIDAPEEQESRVPVSGAMVTSSIVLKQQTGIGNRVDFWIAEDRNTSSDIAIKFYSSMDQSAAGNRTSYHEQLRRMSDLQHPHVCLFFGNGTHEDFGDWVAVRLPAGQSLSDFCQSQLETDGQMSSPMIVDLVEQMAAACDFLHTLPGSSETPAPFILGELTPATVWITRDAGTGRPLAHVVPFPQIIALAGARTADSTDSKNPQVSRDYCSPEVCERQQAVAASDQYSVAVIAYELLTNSTPFKCPRLVSTPLKPIRGLPHLMDAFQKALAWKAENRFGTCTEFAQVLKPHLVSFQNVALDPGQMTGMDISQEPVPVVKAAPEEDSATPVRKAAAAKSKETQLKDSVFLLEQKTSEFNDVLFQLDLLKRELKIAMVGTRGAGKTSLFAAWYLFRGDPQLKLDIATSGETQLYLKKISEQLRRHGSMHATPIAEPSELHFRVSHEGRAWDVRTIDFSGELLNPKAKEDEILAQSTLDFLRVCDIVFVLHDPVETEVELLDAVDTLFQNRTAEVVLLLTKFDRFSKMPGASQGFQEQYRTFLNENPVLRSLYSKVKNTYSHCRLTVVPVSAIGKELKPTDGQPMEIAAFRPFQVFMPLILALKRRRQRIDELENRKTRLAQQIAKLKIQVDSLEEVCRQRANRKAEAVAHLEKCLTLLDQNYHDAVSRIPIPQDTLRKLLTQVEEIRRDARKLEEPDLESRAIQLRWNVRRALQERIPREITGRLHQLSEQINDLAGLVFLQQAGRIREDLLQLQKRATAAKLQQQAERAQVLLASMNARLMKFFGIACGVVIGIIILISVLLMRK